jgi:hypothetical protein
MFVAELLWLLLTLRRNMCAKKVTASQLKDLLPRITALRGRQQTLQIINSKSRLLHMILDRVVDASSVAHAATMLRRVVTAFARYAIMIDQAGGHTKTRTCSKSGLPMATCPSCHARVPPCIQSVATLAVFSMERQAAVMVTSVFIVTLACQPNSRLAGKRRL